MLNHEKHSNITKLEELERVFTEGTIMFRSEEGEPVRVWPIWHEDNLAIAVVRSIVPAGVTFPAHVHEEKEFIVCYAGLGTCTILNDGAAERLHPLAPGKMVIINPGQHHRITAFEDLCVVAMTIPASIAFLEK